MNFFSFIYPFKSKSLSDYNREFEQTYAYYCIECGEKMKSQGMWYCPNSKCKRYGLCSVIILPAPKRLAKEKGVGR